MTRTGKLGARIVPVKGLSAETKAAMWSVFARYYAEISREKFERDLAKKRDVILVHDTGDGSIQGFSTLEVYDRAFDGRQMIAVFSGDTIIESAYWGQRAMQRAFVRYVVGLKLRHLFKPVYWFLISKGYKTYLLLSRNYTTYWPRHERDTPEWESRLIGYLASDKYGEAYVPSRGILHFEECEGRLKEGIAPIAPELLSYPDVRFFLERNPGHASGDELCCLGRIDAGMWTKFTGRLIGHLFAQTGRAARRLWAVATTAIG